MKYPPTLLFLLFLITCVVFLNAEVVLQPDNPAPTYHELYRPGYHFSPPKNWMNDPNGMVFFEGEYHLFYQHNPYGNNWGHLSWGHAVSKDLVYWENLPVAILEYGTIEIFSGSSIVDVNNTSGLCNKAKKAGCMISFYAMHNDKTNTEAVGFAYSNDNGRTYTQYKYNPVIDLAILEFRDPKVFWYEPQKKWVMLVAVAWQYKIRLYSSKDLINWSWMSDFGGQGSKQGEWEDPDLYELQIENQTKKKWVLTHSVDVAKVEYYIGDFDGYKFTNTDTRTDFFFIDVGKDFDEATTLNLEPKGRRLMFAWLTEGSYGRELPTTIWKGQHSLIRELKLRQYPEGLRIVQGPIEELTKLRYSPVHFDNLQLNQTVSTYNITKGAQAEIIARFKIPTKDVPKSFGVKIFLGKTQQTLIGYNVSAKSVFSDRSKGGRSDFSPYFTGFTSHPLEPENGVIELRLFVDQCSVELFANNGKIALSTLVFPDPNQDQIQLYVEGGSVTVLSVDAWLLKGIWP